MKTVVEILIDVSGSMNDTILGGKRKIDFAKEILLDEILPLLNYPDTIGVRLFGGECGIIGNLENIPNDNFSKLKDFILNQIPEPYGKTPLALAIRTAVENLQKDGDANKHIYCITDGGETCGGDFIKEADYANSIGIDCKISMVGIGELDDNSKVQFAYIASRTGGKNINIGKKGTGKKDIKTQLQHLFELGIDDIVDLIDNKYYKNKEIFKRYEDQTIKDFLFGKKLPINFIPSDDTESCQKLLVLEYYDDNIENLVKGLLHIEKCGGANREVLILMNIWKGSFHEQNLKPWYDQYKAKGITRFCVKLERFTSYKEFH